MSKHTPGPWSHRNGRIFSTDNERLTIANVARAHDGDYSTCNGILIAAAPDLLEALYHVVGVAEDYMSYDPDSRFGEAVAAVNAAIAKAEGRE